jgi:ERCC4-related helicase
MVTVSTPAVIRGDLRYRENEDDRVSAFLIDEADRRGHFGMAASS